MGGFAGLIGGLAVSVFSKPLAVVIGLLVFGIQVFFFCPQHSTILPFLCYRGSLERYANII